VWAFGGGLVLKERGYYAGSKKVSQIKTEQKWRSWGVVDGNDPLVCLEGMG